MFNKILIANRAEIATRIVRTCKRLGITTVAVFSEADANAPHVELADEAYCVGPAAVAESYLNQNRLIEIATTTGCEAVHPGYGLLSENASFIARTRDAGLVFIGPDASCVELMGDKLEARQFAKQSGVPVVPGLEGQVDDDEAALAFANQNGYPVLVKAAAGGGGIGMKIAKKDKQLVKALAECRRRGASAFGSDKLYIERYVEQPRHIEIQVFGDHHGNLVHLFERECSVQRRHQKVIEEAPSVLMSRFPGLRERMTGAAVNLARAAEYTNAGTVEFIVDDSGAFYFIEMNTRLQVEHPVTEAITGLDLVEWQLRVAAGEALPIEQSQLHIDGHAIECRLYAENPDKGFLPAPGHIDEYREPTGEGIRMDSGVKANWAVTPYYDPMMAKLISHASTRDQSISKMLTALDKLRIGGITHNAPMHTKILQSEAFIGGDFDTGWLEAWYPGD